MKKLLAVLVAGLFAAGAFAQAPGASVDVPAQSVHSVQHTVKKHHTKHMKRVVHRKHHKAPMRHKM